MSDRGKWMQYMQGGVCTSTDRIDGKVVIVTGANSGIGKETTKELLKRGGKIYMACRSLERGQKTLNDIKQELGTDDNRLFLMQLDLSSQKSVRQFVKEFKSRETKLDILINNAAVLGLPNFTKTEDGFEETFAVNHLGHFLLTHLLMDLIMAASPSRIINVSGRVYEFASMNWEDLNYEKNYNTFNPYVQSKLANILFTRELAVRLKGEDGHKADIRVDSKFSLVAIFNSINRTWAGEMLSDTGVTTYTLHPGVIRTGLTRHVTLIELLYTPFVPLHKSTLQGSQTTICCAVDRNLAEESGKYYSDCVEKELATADALSAEDATRLWNLSVQMVKLSSAELHPKLK